MKEEDLKLKADLIVKKMIFNILKFSISLLISAYMFEWFESVYFEKNLWEPLLPSPYEKYVLGPLFFMFFRCTISYR